MSTFGEIVEPCSRAAFEDWDDMAEYQTPELKWQRDLESPEDVNIFIILEGKYLANNINFQRCNLELINTVPEVNLQLYRSLTTSKYISIISDYDIILSSQIVELLRQYLIVSKFVVTIQSKSLAEYQGAESNSGSIIRAVKTTKSQALHVNAFPKLEQPNLLAGVAAGVINLREHLGECATGLIAFIENPDKVEELELLLDKLSISQPQNRTSVVLNSNLYI